MNDSVAVSIAMKIVAAVERELSDRSGIHWDGLNDDTRNELKRTLIGIVTVILKSQS